MSEQRGGSRRGGSRGRSYGRGSRAECGGGRGSRSSRGFYQGAGRGFGGNWNYGDGVNGGRVLAGDREHLASPTVPEQSGSSGWGSDEDSTSSGGFGGVDSQMGDYRRCYWDYGRRDACAGGRGQSPVAENGGANSGSSSSGGFFHGGGGRRGRSGPSEKGYGVAPEGGRFCFICGNAGHSAKECDQKYEMDHSSSGLGGGGGGDARHLLSGGQLGGDWRQRSVRGSRGGGGGSGGGGRFTGGRGRSSCSICRGWGHSAINCYHNANRDHNNGRGGRIGGSYLGRGEGGCPSITLTNFYRAPKVAHILGRQPHVSGSSGSRAYHGNTSLQAEHLSRNSYHAVNWRYSADSNGGSSSYNYRDPETCATDCTQHGIEGSYCASGGSSSDNRNPGLECNQGENGEDKTSDNGDLFCFTCGKSGHIARDCPISISHGECKCSDCGQMGHSAWDCPLHINYGECGGDQISSLEDDNDESCEGNKNMEKFASMQCSIDSIESPKSLSNKNHEEKQAELEKSYGFTVVEVAKEEDKRREEEDDECCILDYNPYEQPTTDLKGKSSLVTDHPLLSEDEDVSVIAARGQVACRDYPHSRHLCGNYPFSNTAHEKCCPQCYCYVCEIVAPCEDWTGSSGHCHASDRDSTWSMRRTLHRFSLACNIGPD